MLLTDSPKLEVEGSTVSQGKGGPLYAVTSEQGIQRRVEVPVTYQVVGAEVTNFSGLNVRWLL